MPLFNQMQYVRYAIGLIRTNKSYNIGEYIIMS